MRGWPKFLRLNNIKVRNKLLMIYILCIVLPVLTTNVIFANRIIESVNRENADQCNAIMDTALSNIDREFENIINLSTLIYTDSSLDKALETDYTGVVDKVDIYTYFRDYMTRIRSMYSQIVTMSIYTDNATIPLGGNCIFNNGELAGMSWYGQIRNAGKTVLFITYSDSAGKHLSVLRNMDYFYDSRQEKVMKFDLNLNEIASALKSNSGRWEIYLVGKDNKIISSSDEAANTLDGFEPFAALKLSRGDTVIARDLGKYDVLRGWKVVGVFRQEELYASLQHSGVFVAAMALLELIATTAIVLLISRSINKRLKLVAGHMGRHELKTLDCNEGSDEIGEVIREYNMMTLKIQEMIRNEYEYRIEIDNAELERKQAIINALQSQINPHFLFNTLEAIRMRSSIKKEEETAGVIKSLSKMFRRMLNWKEDLIPLEEEIGFVEDYLKVQQYRFGDKVGYSIEADPVAGKIRIPKMTLQPFVENSCFHGIESSKSNGFILIRTVLRESRLSITVQDNGKGMPAERLAQIQANPGGNGGSIGISNVYNRLRLLYGDALRFDITSEPGAGTTVSIEIPVLECAEECRGDPA